MSSGVLNLLRLASLRGMWALTAALACVVVSVNPSVSAATSPKAPPPVPVNVQKLDPVMAAQSPMNDLGRRVQDAIQASHSTGFTGMAFENTTFVLYWHGLLPTPISNALQTREPGIAVKVVPTQYSLETYDRVERYMFTLSGPAAGGNIIWTALLPDFSGLQVTYAATSASAVSSLQRTVSTIAGSMKIVASIGQPLQYQSCPPDNCPPRWDDGAP